MCESTSKDLGPIGGCISLNRVYTVSLCDAQPVRTDYAHLPSRIASWSLALYQSQQRRVGLLRQSRYVVTTVGPGRGGPPTKDL